MCLFIDESTAVFYLNVVVSDGALSSNSNVTILITDVNELPHTLSFSQSTDPLPENAGAGASVGVVYVQDDDGSDTYTFTLDTQSPNDAFALSTDGVLTV